MKKKVIVIALSLVFAFVLMSGGYGLWQDTLTIKGNIEVKQDSEVISAMRKQIELQKQELEEDAVTLPGESEETTMPSENNEGAEEQVEESVNEESIDGTEDNQKYIDNKEEQIKNEKAIEEGNTDYEGIEDFEEINGSEEKQEEQNNDKESNEIEDSNRNIEDDND